MTGNYLDCVTDMDQFDSSASQTRETATASTFNDSNDRYTIRGTWYMNESQILMVMVVDYGSTHQSCRSTNMCVDTNLHSSASTL
jgi:hypothetical protein